MTSRTPSEIANQIIAKMAITIPGLSLAIGSPERKFVDAIAESISEVQVDNYLSSNSLDIDTKSGVDLEDFVSIFGFGRLQGTYATGSLVIYLNIPATQVITIPAGTQFSKSAEANVPTLFFSSTSPVVIGIGDVGAIVPVQSTVIGSVGNVQANTIKGVATSQGISSVTNDQAFTGGTDDESDSALRTRFKKTFLRNITGTTDFYAGIAMQFKNVSRVKVMGPVSDFTTQIQADAASSELTLAGNNCKYVWPKGVAVSVRDDSTTEVWLDENVDYSVTAIGSVINPKIQTLTPKAFSKFLDVNYEYTSTNSRNDPAYGITNKVDVYVDGVNPIKVSEKLVTRSVTLDANAGSLYNIANFGLAIPGSVTLTAGSSKFQRLGSTPIVTFPQSIYINGLKYSIGTDPAAVGGGNNYVGVFDKTVNRGTDREISGIVWKTAAPADGLTSNLFEYVYNQTPQILTAIYKRSKQITTDVLAHQAVIKPMRFYFVVQYDQGASPAQVNPNIVTALNNFISAQGFGAWIQFSDLATVVHNVAGIDNCRIAKLSDPVPYIASETNGAGVAVGTPYTADFQIDDNTLAALDMPVDLTTVFIRRSFNNFS